MSTLVKTPTPTLNAGDKRAGTHGRTTEFFEQDLINTPIQMWLGEPGPQVT
jgi:hypothetical protein